MTYTTDQARRVVLRVRRARDSDDGPPMRGGLAYVLEALDAP